MKAKHDIMDKDKYNIDMNGYMIGIEGAIKWCFYNTRNKHL